MVSATDRSESDVDVLRPTNTIAIVGDKITLPCSSRVDNESRWDFYDVGAINPTSIYNGNRFTAQIGLHVSMNFTSCRYKTCNLTIKSVHLKDAGYYVCFESSRLARKAASLVVLGQLLVISISTFVFDNFCNLI